VSGTSRTGDAANELVSEEVRIRHRRRWCDLIGGVVDAAWFSPLLWPRSVLGPTLKPVPHSEYTLLLPGNRRHLLRLALDILVPSWPGRAPACLPKPLASLLFHQSEELKPPEGRDPDGRFAREEWFFINGILTDEYVARMNAEYLVELFERPIRILWNATDGAVVDLAECLSEKLGAPDEDVELDFHALLRALTDPQKERVVVICHSQGTLIAAVVLRLLKHLHRRTASGTPDTLTPQDREAIRTHARADGIDIDSTALRPIRHAELEKLQLFCFANCATEMTYLKDQPGIPTIESFGNEHDLVARLGMLAPHPGKRHITISGPRFRHDAAWGHLLNAHYLIDIDTHQRQTPGTPFHPVNAAPYVPVDDSAPAGAIPRLFRYLHGSEAIP
jgi:hypothetical protein